MFKVMMAAPFDSKGRYKGGISAVANEIVNSKELLDRERIQLIKFGTCRINRKASGQSSLSLENFKNLFRLYRDLPKEIEAECPDCLYFHSSVRLALLKDLLCIRKAKKKTAIPVVLHIHFAEFEKIMTGKKLLDFLILKLIKKYTDKVVFLSSLTKDQFVERGLNPDNCKVIYNFSTLKYTKEEIEKHINNPSEIKQFLFVGSIDKRKGIFDVLETMTAIDGNFCLNVCGGFFSSDDEEKYNQYSKILGNKLVYHGYVKGEEKRQMFLKSDVLLLTSYGEGLPVVILEAMGAACAVVATKVGAIPEIINKNNGVLINAGDKLQLQEALESYIVKDDGDLIKQKKTNYQTASNYTIDKFIESMAKVCVDAIKS